MALATLSTDAKLIDSRPCVASRGGGDRAGTPKQTFGSILSDLRDGTAANGSLVTSSTSSSEVLERQGGATRQPAGSSEVTLKFNTNISTLLADRKSLVPTAADNTSVDLYKDDTRDLPALDQDSAYSNVNAYNNAIAPLPLDIIAMLAARVEAQDTRTPTTAAPSGTKAPTAVVDAIPQEQGLGGIDISMELPTISLVAVEVHFVLPKSSIIYPSSLKATETDFVDSDVTITSAGLSGGAGFGLPPDVSIPKSLNLISNAVPLGLVTVADLPVASLVAPETSVFSGAKGAASAPLTAPSMVRSNTCTDAVIPPGSMLQTQSKDAAKSSTPAHMSKSNVNSTDAGSEVFRLDAVSETCQPDTNSIAGTLQAIAGAVTQLADAAPAEATAPVAQPLATPVAPTASPARTMNLQLNPADLGTVNVRLHLTGGNTLDVQLSVSDEQTLGMISRERTALTDAITDQTYSLNSLVIQGIDAPKPVSGGNHATTQGNPGGDARPDQRQGSNSQDQTGRGSAQQQNRGANRDMPSRGAPSSGDDQLFV